MTSLESIEVTTASSSLERGQSTQLKAIGVFSDASREDLSQSVSWSSSAPELVTVSEEPGSRGAITGLAVGTVTISARHLDSGKTGQLTVNVLAPVPVLSSVEPTEGAATGGTSLVVRGQGFVPGTTVTIGGVPVSSLNRLSEAVMVAVTPAGIAGTQDIVVTTPRGAVTHSDGFRYRGAPSVTAVEPATGPAQGGTVITLRGADFLVGTTVLIGGAPLQDVTRVDDTTLKGTTPPGGVGTQDLVVTTPYGTGTLPERFRYYEPWVPSSEGLYGGSVTALARHPSDPSLLYAGTAQGGVFRSVNGGQAWTAINRGLTTLDVRALAIDPSTPSTVYAGTSQGLFKSTDSGASWFLPSDTLRSSALSTVLVDPAHPTTVYAGGPRMGISKSDDAGATWTAINTGLGGSLYVLALAMDPTDSRILYTGTYGGALFKTVNGGERWALAGGGLPDTATYIHSLAIDPRAPRTVYAGTPDGIYKSTNGGDSWTLGHTGMGSRLAGPVLVALDSASTVYAGTLQGLYKSADGGASWSLASGGLPASGIYALLVDPSSPATLYAGVAYGGLFKSTNAAASWSASGTGLTSLAVSALEFSSVPDTAYAGTFNGVFKTADGGATWSEINHGLDNRNIRVLAVHPADPSVAYAGTFEGLYKTVNGGTSWSKVFAPSSRIDALAIHPTSPERVFVGTTQGLFKSSNGGAAWTPLTEGLPSTAWIEAIAISRQNPSVLYIASSIQGQIFQSTDEGARWTLKSSGRSVALGSGVLQVKPGTTDTLYLLVSEGRLLKSTNAGASWETALPNTSGALAFDPSDAQTLYVWTPTGLRKSRDGGRTWKGVSSDFLTGVGALAVKPGAPLTILAGTLGRGVYKTTTAGE